MEKHQIDICGLSETKKKGKGTTAFGRYILIYSGKGKQDRAHSGVGILIHEKFTQCIENIEYVDDRILNVSLKINNIVYNLISTYAPDISKPREESEHFYEKLQDTVNELGNKDRIIIFGDLNARIGNDEIANVKQRFNEPDKNENGELLIDFCARNELRINNTYFPHKDQHKYTFNNTRGQRSMIDFVITNREITPEQVLDVRALTSANLGTDHNLILCKVHMERPNKFKKKPLYVEKHNIESLSTESTQELYKNRLSEKLQTQHTMNQDIDSKWTRIRNCVLDAADESIGKRKVNVNITYRAKPWFTPEIKKLAEEKRESYLTYRSSPTQEKLTKYVETRNKVNSRIKTIKREHWAKFTSDMDHDIFGAQRKVWKMLKNRKKPVNEFIQTKTIKIEDWQHYFEELYTDEEKPELKRAGITDPEPGRIISEEEVSVKLKKLKNRKASGVDNIPNELLKYGGHELAKELTVLFNDVLKTTTIPEDWHRSYTIPIFKKGIKTIPENYRGITLLCSAMKLFTSLIKDILESQITNREEQQGFRKQRSTTDAIFVLRQIKEKAIEFNTPAYVCFVDLTKAFDKVRLSDVLRLLAEHSVHPDIIEVIRRLNNNNTTKIKVNGQMSDDVHSPGGIRQGDSLSPFLFNLIMDEIIKEVTSLNLGYRLNKNTTSMVCYADDAAIIAETEDDLQRQLYKFYKTSKLLNMNIATSKTKSMTFSRDIIRCKLVVENEIVEQVMQFKYLGADITSGHDPVKELRGQINKALVMSGCLRDVAWNNKYMRRDSKVRIYKTCVRPIMTYGIETRADTTRTKTLLRTAEMKTLRVIAGKTLRDHERNANIREQCDVCDVVRWGRQRRRQWYEHVRRMDENRLPRRVLEGRPLGSRQPGRPPKRWRDSWQSTSQEHR